MRLSLWAQRGISLAKQKQWASVSAYRLKAGLDYYVETADSMKIKRHGLYIIRNRGTGIP